MKARWILVMCVLLALLIVPCITVQSQDPPKSPPSADLVSAKSLMDSAKYFDAIPILTKVIATNGDDASEALFSRGRCHELLREYPEAIADYTAVRSTFSTSSFAVDTDYWVGHANEASADPTDKVTCAARLTAAIASYTNYLTANPKGALRGKAMLRKAACLRQQKKSDDCLSQLDALIKEFPDMQRQAYYEKGVCYQNQKNYTDAFPAFEKGIALAKTPAEAEEGQLRVEECLRWTKQYDGDIEYLDKLYNDVPADYASTLRPKLLLRKAAILYLQEKYTDEKAVLAKVVADYPNTYYGLDAQSRLLHTQAANAETAAEFDTSRKAIRDFITANPGFDNIPEFEYYWAFTYYKQRNWTAARDAFRKLYETMPEKDVWLPSYKYREAQCERFLGNLEAAKKAYSDCIARFPSNPFSADANNSIKELSIKVNTANKGVHK